jgi:ParB family transcriptional regulator, chromosome partitioning protein
MDPIVKALPISQIHPSPHQARKMFDNDNLRGLAESMKQEGLLNPVVVRKVGSTYELISGERRLRAAKLLSWPTLEAKVIGTVSEAEAAAKGLIENIQREDLNTIEEAEGYRELNRLDPKYWNQNKIAQNCGKTQGHVSEFLRFLTLPEGVKGYIRRRILSAGHAAELIRIKKPNAQKKLAHRIIKGKWSVMQTRDAVDRKLGKKPPLSAEGKEQKAKDPFASVWPTGDWKIDYGPRKLDPDEDAQPIECWSFMVPNPGQMQQTDLARWFRQMAEALDPKSKPVQEVKQPAPVGRTPINPRVSMMLPTNEAELETMTRERENMRLPQNPEEEAELAALSAAGPYTVYQWIYGADSVTAGKVKGRTWSEWGVTDPAAGARGMVIALRKILQLSKV